MGHRLLLRAASDRWEMGNITIIRHVPIVSVEHSLLKISSLVDFEAKIVVMRDILLRMSMRLKDSAVFPRFDGPAVSRAWFLARADNDEIPPSFYCPCARISIHKMQNSWLCI